MAASLAQARPEHSAAVAGAPVLKGRLTVTVTESGNLKSANSTVLKSVGEGVRTGLGGLIASVYTLTHPKTVLEMSQDKGDEN